MARILLAWELGTNLGHLAPMRALAKAFRANGHRCMFAVRELEAAEECLEPELGAIVQAPLRINAIQNPLRVQVSYASLLHNTGFDDVMSLTGRLRAWREILQKYSCELLVTDHAPTAIAAAFSLGLPALQTGNGFTVPPLTRPFPVFHPRFPVSEEILLHNESKVLAALGAAFDRLGVTAPVSLQQVLGHAQPALLTYPELDHYEAKRSEPYLGLPDMNLGTDPQWPAGDGAKIFAYLRPSKHFQALLAALRQLPARVLIRVGGIAPGKLREYERPGLQITGQPINFRLAAQSCDAFINYAAHGTSAEMLLAGKPGLLLPDNVERDLMARRVQQLGAGLVPPAGAEFNLSAALRQIIDDPSLRKAAEFFAQRHAAQNRHDIMQTLAARTLAALKNPQPGAPADS